MSKYKIGVLGFGNLGKALVTALLKQDMVSSEDLFVCARSDATLTVATKQFHIAATGNARQLINECDYIFLTVHKKVFFELTEGFDPVLLSGKIFISFMAGITLKSMEAVLPGAQVMRAIPTLSMDSGNGIIGYTTPCNKYSHTLLNSLGYAFLVEEDDIEKVTAFASCGLGFAARLIDSYIQAGAALGFETKDCRQIAAANFAAALKYADCQQLIKAVATKGGATEAGLWQLDNDGLDRIVNAAVMAAYDKMTAESKE